MSEKLYPEQKARVKIDKQLNNAGWDIVARDEYISGRTSAVKETLMRGNTESDYLLFIDDKAIAVLEAKKEDNDLGNEVAVQAEGYAVHPQNWYGCWKDGLIPLVYMANGKKIYFKNMLVSNSDYVELSEVHTPKKMLQIIGEKSEYALRGCYKIAEAVKPISEPMTKLAEKIGLKSARTRQLLKELLDKELIKSNGKTVGKRYI